MYTDLRNKELTEFISCRRFGIGFSEAGALVVQLYTDPIYSTIELYCCTSDELRKLAEMFFLKAKKIDDSIEASKNSK